MDDNDSLSAFKSLHLELNKTLLMIRMISFGSHQVTDDAWVTVIHGGVNSL